MTRRSSSNRRTNRRRRSATTGCMAPNEVLPVLDSLAAVDFGDPDSACAHPVVPRGGRVAAALRVRQRRRCRSSISPTVRHVPSATRARGWDPTATELVPGFISVVGDDNFVRFLTNESIRTPLLRVLAWNFAFAFFSVAISFGVGLGVSLLFEDLPGTTVHPRPADHSLPDPRARVGADLAEHAEPGAGHDRRVLRSRVRIVAAVLPRRQVDSLALDHGQHLAVLPVLLRRDVGGPASDPRRVLRRCGGRRCRLVAAFPLHHVPAADRHRDAVADRFVRLQLQRLQPRSTSSTRATHRWPTRAIPIGHTDILISFVYKLAFVSSARAPDYGFGAAISVALFVVIGSVTWFQLRATRALEERMSSSSSRRSRRSWWWRYTLAVLMIGFAVLPVLWVDLGVTQPGEVARRRVVDPEQPESRQLRRPDQPSVVPVRDVAVELDQDHGHRGDA